MKIRNGFVSNSSSSSFIVDLGRKITSKEELSEIMGECSPLVVCDSMSISSEEVIDYVWENMKFAQPDSVESSLSDKIDNFEVWEISNYLFSEVIENIQEKCWNGENVTIPEFKQLILEELDKKLIPIKETKITINLEDSCSFGSALEHGEIFRNCPHVERISHH